MTKITNYKTQTLYKLQLTKNIQITKRKKQKL